VLIATGLAVGWRAYHGVGDALLAVGLSLLFAFAATWAGAWAGMMLRSPEAAQQLPMQHPELAVVVWSVALIAMFAPTAVYLYRRKVLR